MGPGEGPEIGPLSSHKSGAESSGRRVSSGVPALSAWRGGGRAEERLGDLGACPFRVERGPRSGTVARPMLSSCGARHSSKWPAPDTVVSSCAGRGLSSVCALAYMRVLSVRGGGPIFAESVRESRARALRARGRCASGVRAGGDTRCSSCARGRAGASCLRRRRYRVLLARAGEGRPLDRDRTPAGRALRARGGGPARERG